MYSILFWDFVSNFKNKIDQNKLILNEMIDVQPKIVLGAVGGVGLLMFISLKILSGINNRDRNCRDKITVFSRLIPGEDNKDEERHNYYLYLQALISAERKLS